MIEARLNELLKERGRSLYWLAKQTGMTELALSNIRKGKTKGIDFETLDRICEALQCDPGDILVRNNSKKGGHKK